MSRNIRFVAPLLLIAAVAFAGCGDSGTSGPAPTGPFALEAAPADDLANLCPEGAIAFVRIENLKALDAEILKLVMVVAPEEANDASVLTNIGNMLGNPTLDGLALDKPAGIAIFMGPGGPAPVAIMPLADKAAFEAKTAGNPSVKVIGDYAAWSPSPNLLETVKAGGKASALAASVMAGDIAVAVNMAAVQPLRAPMFDQMDQAVDMMKQQVPGPAGEMYVGMAGAFKTIMTDAGEFGMAATLEDGKLDVAYRYVAKEGSETAKKIAAGKASGKSLLGYIDGGDFMVVEMMVSGESMWSWFGGFYESMFASADPEALTMLRKSFMLMDGVAAGVSFDGGFSETFVMGITDEKEYEELLEAMPKLFATMMESMKSGMPEGADLPMDMEFSAEETWEHAGVTVRNFSMKIALKDMPGMSPDDSATAKKMIAKLLVGETIEYHIGLVNGHAVGVVGANAAERTAALIDRVKSGKPGDRPAAMARATAGFPSDTVMVFTMDFASLLKLVSDIEKIPVEIRQKLANPPAGLNLSGFVTNDGKAVGYGVRYDLMAIATYIKSFME